ncbi:MAG: DUF4339 domain-containing protein [Victivallaceae bacterium]|nr:DUF4339 domain-containing protein [Victivallaceae bacterium]
MEQNAAKEWYYEEDGARKGPVSETKMTALIDDGTLTYGNIVWKNGMPEWLKLENSELGNRLNATQPPPLHGELVNNKVVWVLAFAPIIGLMLEYFIAGAVHCDNEQAATVAAENADFWYVTLILNILLCWWDERRLARAGYDTERFRGWVWLVPVYLYQRAKKLKHNLAYFIVWIVCFILAVSA